MNKYLEAEKRLAELLGYKVETISDVIWVIVPDPDPSSGGSRREWLPRWTRDNAAAFALMVEQGLAVQINDELHNVQVTTVTGPVLIQIAKYADHPDKEAAVRYAIVMAVIAKLETQHD